MADRTGEVLALHSVVADYAREMSLDISNGRLNDATHQLAGAITGLVDVRTVPGTHAFRAKAAAVRRYFKLTECDDDGELPDGADLSVQAVWSLLNDLVGH